MKQRSKSFHDKEFVCRDGSYIPMKDRAIEMIQAVRDELDKPIIINSAYRSPAYNKKIGGAPASKHMLAEAIDFSVPGMRPVDVYAVVLYVVQTKFKNLGGIGLYDTFVHVDCRNSSTRWDLRKGSKGLKVPTYTGKPKDTGIPIFINGKESSVRGYLSNDRTMIPLREIGETLGFAVGYSEKDKLPTIGGKLVTVKGEVKEGRTFYHVRDIADILPGVSVKWNATKKAVEVSK